MVRWPEQPILRTFVSRIVLYAILAVLVAACGPQGDLSFLDGDCGGLFRLDNPGNDSSSAKPHLPSEAQTQLPNGSSSTPVPAPTVAAAVLYPPKLELLNVETVFVGPGEFWSDYLLSPDERQLALRTSEGVFIHDMTNGYRRSVTTETNSLKFWTSNHTLILESNAGLYEYDLAGGPVRNYQIRWEYNGPTLIPPQPRFYTGWQLTSMLELSQQAVCQAVNDKELASTASEDGSRIVPADQVSTKGVELVRREHPDLLSYDQVASLRLKAGSVSSVVAGETRSAIKKYYWPRILVLHGLPSEPHNLLIYAASESQWSGHPTVENQLIINDGGIDTWSSAHPVLYVAPNRGPKLESDGYKLALYRKPTANTPTVELGRIPYPIAYGTRMDWSPTKQYIYFKQSAGGSFSVSRLSLDQFLSR